MNLLPPWVQLKQKRRSVLMRLATVQVAIFFILAAVVYGVSVWERYVWVRSAQLNILLAEFDYAPREIAEQLQAAISAAAYLDEFSELSMPAFWTREVLNTIPNNVRLVRLNYFENELLIVVETPYLTAIGEHMAKLAEAFNSVRLGQIAGGESGEFTYELWVRFSP